MAMSRWDRFGLDWPPRWRRWLDLEGDQDRWLRVEEMREDDTLVVRAEVPGIDPDKDVDVSVTEGVLHIAAKREEKAEHRAKGWYRSEFAYGEFSRDLPLPTGVEASAVKASYKDGILEVRIPWLTKHEPTPAKVPVSRS